MKAQHLSLPATMMSLKRGLLGESMYWLFNFFGIKRYGRIWLFENYMPGTNTFDSQTKCWTTTKKTDYKNSVIVDVVWSETGWQTSKKHKNSLSICINQGKHSSKTEKVQNTINQNHVKLCIIKLNYCNKTTVVFSTLFLVKSIYSIFSVLFWYYQLVFCLEIYINVQFTCTYSSFKCNYCRYAQKQVDG